MFDKNNVLYLVKQNGPVLPRDIVKELGSDTFFTGAVLSQLVDDKQVKLTYTKVGTSPLYYVDGQEEKLQILYKYLHEKEKKAYDILKEEKIIRDNSTDPSFRVALRELKDFAKPLEVNINDIKEIFWKWYMLSNTDAEPLIRSIVLKDRPKKEENIIEENTKEVYSKNEEHQSKLGKKTESKEKEIEKSKKESYDDLLNRINNIFEGKKVKILSVEIIRKNSDIEMIIEIPSPVGDLKYYCKIKDKKKSTDKDLSSIFVDGQIKKLPILYITTGNLTKKAKTKITDEFKTISVMYI